MPTLPARQPVPTVNRALIDRGFAIQGKAHGQGRYHSWLPDQESSARSLSWLLDPRRCGDGVRAERGVQGSLPPGTHVVRRLSHSAIRSLFLMAAFRANQDDAGNRVIRQPLDIPSLADGPASARQILVTIPAAALAPATNGFQCFMNVNGQFCSGSLAIQACLPASLQECFRHVRILVFACHCYLEGTIKKWADATANYGDRHSRESGNDSAQSDSCVWLRPEARSAEFRFSETLRPLLVPNPRTAEFERHKLCATRSALDSRFRGNGSAEPGSCAWLRPLPVQNSRTAELERHSFCFTRLDPHALGFPSFVPEPQLC